MTFPGLSNVSTINAAWTKLSERLYSSWLAISSKNPLCRLLGHHFEHGKAKSPIIALNSWFALFPLHLQSRKTSRNPYKRVLFKVIVTYESIDFQWNENFTALCDGSCKTFSWQRMYTQLWNIANTRKAIKRKRNQRHVGNTFVPWVCYYVSSWVYSTCCGEQSCPTSLLFSRPTVISIRFELFQSQTWVLSISHPFSTTFGLYPKRYSTEY